MSEHKNLQDVDLLSYWQSQLWRAQFNQFNLTADSLPPHVVASDANINSSDFEENELIWLALMLQGNPNVTLPIFLPAQVQQGRVALRSEPELPWIPGVFFSPDSQLYFKHGACYEDFLRFECLNKQQAYVFSDFSDFQAACLNLLDTLFEEKWQTVVESLGLMDQGQWLIFRSSDLIVGSSIESRVMNHYGQFENKEAKDDINDANFFDYAHLMHVQMTGDTLGSADLRSVLSILSLKKGGIQAIKSPIGTNTQKIIQNVLANQFTAQALGNKPSPNIGVFSRNPQKMYFDNDVFLDKNIFMNYCQKILAQPELTDLEEIIQVIHQKMKLAYEENLQAMSLMRVYAKAQKENRERYNDVSQFLSKLADEDDKTDSDRQKYLEIHAHWQSLQKSHNLLQKCFSIVPFVKSYRQKKAGQFLEKALEHEPVNIPYEQQLIEYIRALKVKQAKNDQKRIQAVDFSNQLHSAKANWQKWAKRHDDKQALEAFDMMKLFQILAPIQQELWQLCSLYWQAQNMQNTDCSRVMDVAHTEQWSLQVLNPFDKSAQQDVGQELDYLFIEESHLLSPIQLLSILPRAKRAIFLGDNLASIGRCLFSKVEDEYYFKKTQMISEQDLECLQASGHLLSSGNAFQIAQNNSEFQSLSPCGLYRSSHLSLDTIQNKNEILFEYWNKHYHHSFFKLKQLSESNGPSISFVPVLGNMRLGLNVAEIEKIVSFIQNDLEKGSQVAVVTPFYHQKELLVRLLDIENVSVHTFDNLPQEPIDFVIFSPVYTASTPRPHLYDEGPAYFYRLLALAKKSIWIFGDQAIFDEHTHSPSGQVAKFLRKHQAKEMERETA